MKAQIEGPLYTVVFLGVMVGTLVVMEDVVRDWNSTMELLSEANRLVGYGGIVSIFSNYSMEYAPYTPINITINRTTVAVEAGGKEVLLNNTCHFENKVLNNISIVRIRKSEGRLTVDGE